MNRADPCAGKKRQGRIAERGLRMLCSLLLLVWAIPGTSQTSDNLARGLSEFRAGDYGAAAAHFARAEEAAPGATDALLYESKAHVHLEQFTAAETALRRYLLLHAASGDALYLLGYVLHRESKATESLETYTKAVQYRAPAGDDLKIVGLNYVLLNDYPDAIKWLEKAVEAEPRIRKPGTFWGARITRNPAFPKHAKHS